MSAPRPPQDKPHEADKMTARPNPMETSENLIAPFTEAEHREWRRKRANESQRQRRAKARRIDYYVSDEAAAIIDAQAYPSVGGDQSSVINRIVMDWAKLNRIRSGIK